MVDGRVGWVMRVGAVVVVAALLAGTGTAWAVGALADPEAQKAAAKCQALIAKTTAKALATKLKAYDGCAAAALACVQTKAGKAGCDTKAASTCTKKLGSAVTAAAKAKTKITGNKSCLALSTADLLGSDGLGFGDIAGPCSADFGINVCNGLGPIADCLLTSHDRNAGTLFARGLPRTSELVGLLPGAPFTDAAGLSPSPAGCGGCNADAAKRKSVEKCGKALANGTAGLAKALEDAFGKCTLALYDCAQLEDGGTTCVSDATEDCTKAATKVTKAVTKLGTAATKGCGADFAAASATNGLNLGGLAARCADLSVSPLDGANAFANCLTAETRCAVAALVQTALPRTAEFLAAAQAGELAAALGATCPALAPLATAETLQGFRAAGQPRGIFGSILKIMRSVKRTSPSAVGVRASGGKPTSSGGAGGVRKASGPKRVGFGTVAKYKVSYHGPRSRIGGGLADAPPPALIVAVTRSDVVLDDHFEIPTLALPGDGSDIEDEIDIEFADDIPACAFDLNFATVTDGAVSDYVELPQIVDNPVTTTTDPVELVSQGPAGVQQDAAAHGANIAISATGRYVVFTTAATNLISPPDTNGSSDVYVRDRCVSDGVPVPDCTASITRESLLPGDEPFHDGAAGHVGISDDGRFVAFTALQDNDPNPPLVRTFVKDRCVSNGQPVDSCFVGVFDASFDGESGTSAGRLTALSSDGRFVVFTSSTSFGPGLPRVFLHDTCASSSDPVYPGCEPFLDRISDSFFGGEPNGDSDYGAVSRSGRFIAYRSSGSDILAPGEDTNDTNDVFLRDHCIDPATGTFVSECARTTERINVTPDLEESVGDDPTTPSLTNVAISDNGRFVAFTSTADDLLGAGTDTNGKRDVFVRDRCIDNGIAVEICVLRTERVNVGPGGTESNGDIPGGYAIGMSANGRLVVFASDATNLLGPAVGQPNGTFQIFMRDRCIDNGAAIPGCTPATTLVSAAPDGGLGVGSSDRPAIAAGGSATAFGSAAENLLGPGVDANNLADVFVRDR